MLTTELPERPRPTAAQTKSWLSQDRLPIVVVQDLTLKGMKVMGLGLHKRKRRRGSGTVLPYVLDGNTDSPISHRIWLTLDAQCARCRKRKIKCTGDNHDGNGCEACQAAGVPKASCHYLRVRTTNIYHSDPSIDV